MTNMNSNIGPKMVTSGPRNNQNRKPLPLWLVLITTMQIIVISIIIQLVHGLTSPTIEISQSQNQVDLGDSIDLTCSAQYAANYPIIWQKLNPDSNDPPLFISRGAALSVLDNRYSIRHDGSSSTYTLQISKIQESDAGLYQCQVVMGPASRVTADTYLKVRVPPLILDKSSRGVIAGLGDTFTLNCYATGNPEPKISWRRENNGLLPSGKDVEKSYSITVRNASKDDRGIYFCIADNGVGKPARRSVGVEIEFPPDVTSVSNNYYQAIGQPAELHCSIEASPQPDVIWLKDSYEIVNDNNYQISSTSSNDFIQSVLRIKRVDQTHFARYRCRAINKLGDRFAEMTLIKSPEPVCPPACSDGEHLYSLRSSATSGFTIGIAQISISLYLPISMSMTMILRQGIC